MDQEVSQLIKDLNLEVVKDTNANKLSGGQKRKLSVGLALIGNPPVSYCILKTFRSNGIKESGLIRYTDNFPR